MLISSKLTLTPGMMFFFYTIFPLALLEFLIIQFFIKRFYFIGIPMFKKRIPIRCKDLFFPFNNKITKKEGVFRFYDDETVLFYSRISLETFQDNLLFRLKATGKIFNNELLIIARLPLTISFLLPTCIIITILEIYSKESLLNILIPILLSIILLGIIIGIWIYIKRKNINKMIIELEEILTGEALNMDEKQP